GQRADPRGTAEVGHRGQRALDSARPAVGTDPPAEPELAHPPAQPPDVYPGTDLLTVRTLTFRTLYVLVFVGHARRELVHLNVAASPTAAWVWRQLIQATPW